jgi:hypothetical protein
MRVGCGRSSDVHGAWSLLQSDARNAHDRHPSMRASASDYSAKAARKPRPEGQNCTRRHAPSMPPCMQLVQFAGFMHQTRQSLVDLLLAHTRSTRTARTSCTTVRYDCAGNLWHAGCGQREREGGEAWAAHSVQLSDTQCNHWWQNHRWVRACVFIGSALGDPLTLLRPHVLERRYDSVGVCEGGQQQVHRYHAARVSTALRVHLRHDVLPFAQCMDTAQCGAAFLILDSSATGDSPPSNLVFASGALHEPTCSEVLCSVLHRYCCCGWGRELSCVRHLISSADPRQEGF